ncbi:MAG: hypothetical protein HY914_02210 [Desulfomonile tiedjei]|nr:hypothetical protein [Desulfomonile tiedjei]
MVGDKQEQTAEGESIALQAGRDIININCNFSPDEVTRFPNDFFQKRDEADQQFQHNARNFLLSVADSLKAASIDSEKLRDPDFQMAITDAVKAIGRKGNKGNPDLLTRLIAERGSKQPSDFVGIVISEAMQVVPRLTPPHISFLSFVHFVTSVTITGLIDVSGLEPYGRKALVFSSPAFNLPEAQKRHIVYTGCCSIIKNLGGNIYDHLRKVYSQFGCANEIEFANVIKSQAPSFREVVRQFQKEGLLSCTLTSVGQAIAIANISNHGLKLDYSEWLK